ncbi:hypothetical protein [Sphingomonas sp. TX0522]|nr:hypothetical protein [Sphingomonas sp. TX0522]
MALIRPEDALIWRELWAIEMRKRRWLWIGNAVLICAGIGQALGTLS